METGVQVRLKSNPGRSGSTTGRSITRAGRTLVEVRFSDGVQYVPDDQLETVEETLEHPLDLLRQGKVGTAGDLRRTLTHVRLSGRLANLLYSMEITKTDFYAYQFKPVLRMLNSPTNGLLIADEVGLGKTIEAGLIWTELKARFDYRRLLVLCSPILREKWRRELSNRFGIRAELRDAKQTLELLERSRNEGAYAEFAIICSYQGLRPRKSSESERETPSSALAKFLEKCQHEAPLLDLLIIDEAAALKNPGSKTAKLGKLLRSVSEHIVLLTATPIHLGSQDLFQLLQHVDEDTFDSLPVFDNILEANAPLVKAFELVLRGEPEPKELIELFKRASEHAILQDNRQLQGLLTDPPTAEDLGDPQSRSQLAARVDSINILGSAVTRTRKRDVHEWRIIRRPNPEKVPLTGPEKEFYDKVTNLVREFCAKYSYHEGFLLVTPQRQMSSSMPAALRDWQSRRKQYLEEFCYEDLGLEEAPFESAGPLTKELISKANKLGNLQTLWDNDSKFRRLVEVLRGVFQKNPDDKLVIFSYFRATLFYLRERLTSEGHNVTALFGGAKINKDEVIDQFRNPKGPNILLSTEVGSEGIDLQFSSILINYDLPWNPMRVEQRIGRIDRLGQQADRVVIWDLFYENTIDDRIYSRLYKRLKIFEQALGGLEPILGDNIRKLTFELLSQKLSPDEESERIEQRVQAMAMVREAEEKLEEEAAHLVAHGDYILNQVTAARELHRWIGSRDLQVYVTDFFNLKYPGCDFRQSEDDGKLFEVSLSNKAILDLEEFMHENKLKTPTRLTRSQTSKVRCYFENKLQDSFRNAETINQAHPLIRFVTHRIERKGRYGYPAVSVRVGREVLGDNVQSGVYVFSVQKWSVHGIQDTEQLYYACISYDHPEGLLTEDLAERLILAAAVQGRNWLEAHNLVDFERAFELANDSCLAHSDAQYEQYVTDIRAQNEDRADIQTKNLDSHLSKQLGKYEEIRLRHLQHGRESLAKATQATMDKLRNRVKLKKLEIEKRRSLSDRKDEICVGVVQVL